MRMTSYLMIQTSRIIEVHGKIIIYPPNMVSKEASAFFARLTPPVGCIQRLVITVA